MSNLVYVRVYPWAAGALVTKLPHTEICGVAILDFDKHIPKIKANGRWINWEDNECKFWKISKAEFETDLAFELWPQLQVKYRPSWLISSSRKEYNKWRNQRFLKVS